MKLHLKELQSKIEVVQSEINILEKSINKDETGNTTPNTSTKVGTLKSYDSGMFESDNESDGIPIRIRVDQYQTNFQGMA